jgi:invasion protein IalB
MVSMVRLGFGAALFALAVLSVSSIADAAEEKRFDDWMLRCAERAPPDAPRCIITQDIVSNETNLGIVSAAIYYRPGKNTPTLGFNLAPQAIKQKGMSLQIDDKPSMDMQIQGCNDKFCGVRVNFPDDVMKQFRTGKSGVVSFSVPPEKRIGAKISLKGFSAAMKVLEQRRDR